MRADELAKSWLIAILEREPLARAPAVAGLAAHGPEICATVVRAVADDEALVAICRGGPLERLVASAGTAAGARTAEEISRSVEALRAVIWIALRRALPDAHADDVALLAERVAVVVEEVRAAALRQIDVVWPATLEQEIARARAASTSLSLLFVELADLDRLLAVEPLGEARALLAGVESVIREVAGAHQVLIEEPGVWVIAPGLGRSDADELGSRLASAVRSLPEWRGAPLRASVGVAIFGQDGDDAAGLIAKAQERSLHAAAGGIEISRSAIRSDAGATPRRG
jgi:GGDEF domain-containing protein